MINEENLMKGHILKVNNLTKLTICLFDRLESRLSLPLGEMKKDYENQTNVVELIYFNKF